MTIFIFTLVFLCVCACVFVCVMVCVCLCVGLLVCWCVCLCVFVCLSVECMYICLFICEQNFCHKDAPILTQLLLNDLFFVFPFFTFHYYKFCQYDAYSTWNLTSIISRGLMHWIPSLLAISFWWTRWHFTYVKCKVWTDTGTPVLGPIREDKVIFK